MSTMSEDHRRHWRKRQQRRQQRLAGKGDRCAVCGRAGLPLPHEIDLDGGNGVFAPVGRACDRCAREDVLQGLVAQVGMAAAQDLIRHNARMGSP